jgi:hypothetical protein
MAIGADGINVRPPTPLEASAVIATVGDVRQEIYQRALQRIVGQQLPGQVLSRFTDGSFLVKVADTAARVILPTGTQVGDSLSLTLISLQPRPTFLLGSDTSGKLAKTPLVFVDPHGAAVLGADEGEPPAAGGKTPLIYLEQQSTPHNGGKLGAGSTNLSSAGQLIDNFIQAEDAQGSGQVRTARLQTEQLNQAPPANAGSLAEALAAAGNKDSAPALLSNAGRLINNLLQAAQQEGAPTALLGKTAVVPTPAALPQQVALALHDTLAYSGLFYESHVVEWADGKRPIAELLREPQMQGQHGADKVNNPDPSQIQFPQLVNLQLNTLEHQNAHWRGEIWPGQQMEWDVRKDPQQGKAGGGEPEEQQSWQSAVRFNLPSLGSVSATIHLIGDRLHILVNTASASTAAALRENAASLADALGAAGSPLDSLLVKQDELKQNIATDDKEQQDGQS